MSNAEPMTVAEFTRRLDELVANFAAGAESMGDTSARAIRAPRASWCLALSHAEHRVHAINGAAGVGAGHA
jgi:hypothetical protein